MLALFDYLNAATARSPELVCSDDTTLTLSERWDRACDYLDEDIASGYVRVLQELIAASWADPTVAKVVRTGLKVGSISSQRSRGKPNASWAASVRSWRRKSLR